MPHNILEDIEALLEEVRASSEARINPSLKDIRRILAALGNPQDKIPPAFHISGTNGKGSTLAFLRGALEAAGKHVHVHTSPHLVRFNERVRLAGKLIEDEYLLELLERVVAANAGGHITYFEATTAVMFLAFSEVKADYSLIEVGLGGTWDATNVLSTEKVVATLHAPVDLDHAFFLGTHIPTIARDKADIMKPGKPAVVGFQRPEALEAIKAVAAEREAKLVYIRHDYNIKTKDEGFVFDGLGYDEFIVPELGLKGKHQIGNAALALAALAEAQPPGFEAGHVIEGFASAHWPGRFHQLSKGNLTSAYPELEIWVDGAHNPHGALSLKENLEDLQNASPKKLAFIIAMQNNKDHADSLRYWAQLSEMMFCVPVPNSNISEEPEKLALMAHDLGMKAAPARFLETALKLAEEMGFERIMICGSLYLVGDVLEQNGSL